jgi:SAM-dependent methyltransferase
MMAKCPLCNGISAASTENVPVERVVKMYKKLLNIAVESEFGELSSITCIRCLDCDLTYFYPPVSGSELFYEKLQLFNWYYMAEKNEYEFVRNYVKVTDDVLEIGCGKGAFKKFINCHSYLGLEFSKEAQKLAVNNGVEVVNESIENHSANNTKAYDVVCSFQVLEHVIDVRSFIKSAVTCLKSGGLLIFTTPSTDSFAAFAPNSILDMPPHHATRWSDVSYKNIENLYDLDLIELWHEPLHAIHRQFYFQTILTNVFMNAFNQANRVWNESLIYKFIYLTARFPAKFLSLFVPKNLFVPRGISVTAVFRKRW